MTEHCVDSGASVAVRHREDLPGRAQPVPDRRVDRGRGDGRLVDSGQQAAAQRSLGLDELGDRVGAAHARREFGQRVVSDRVGHAPRDMRQSLANVADELKQIGTVNRRVIER
jgi:hypothetical protein